MRVLIIKTSSLGDIIHTYPALTDAVRAIPDIRFDWLVEESFVDLPLLHPAVDEVIALPWRRLRKRLFSLDSWRELASLRRRLQSKHYDLVIDAQGLLKSAIWTRLINAPIHGLASDSAREPLASHFYQITHSVAWGQHAITRVRELFAKALAYPLPNMDETDFHIAPKLRSIPSQQTHYWVFAHATTWESKHWPEAYWQALILFARQQQRQVLLPWGNDEEHERAERLARLTQHVEVLPKLELAAMTRVLAGAECVVGVDTGLTHLAAALHRPVVAIYGATEPGLTGVIGPKAKVLQAKFPCAPCMRERCIELTDQQLIPPCYEKDMSVQRVSEAIQNLLDEGSHAN
ncbi:MAG TPA: lipopolysaccharide heptosyltransferase I [Thiotrichales bacterium]|nr:lipopolysaccharide heptosyltransferase I [Thiotrichales bacterium]